MNKIYKSKLILLLLLSNVYSYSQSIDIATPGNNLLSSFEKAFIIIASLIFIFFAAKQIQAYQDHEDVWKVIRNIVFFIIGVIVVIAVYRYVKQLSL